MIPFRTSVTGHASPNVTMSLIVANIALFVIQVGLPPETANRFVYSYGLVPVFVLHPQLAEHYLVDYNPFLALITNVFMHGGWLHLIINMWTLWLFGVPVEDRLGSWRFLLFYLACGVGGSLGHLLFNLDSAIPVVGASGAIAGVLGAFTWLFTRATVTVVVPIIIIPLMFSIPAVLYTLFWFALQVVQGWMSYGDAASGGGIAWFAHLGGFVVGVTIAAWLTGWRRPAPTRGPR